MGQIKYKKTRREHAGGVPKVARLGKGNIFERQTTASKWVGVSDFPYSIVDGFTEGEDEKLYPIEKFSGALKSIALWIFNDGIFQGPLKRGVSERAMVFAFMIAPESTGCKTQADLAERLGLSRPQVNEYIKQFSKRFDFVSGATYSKNQIRR